MKLKQNIFAFFLVWGFLTLKTVYADVKTNFQPQFVTISSTESSLQGKVGIEVPDAVNTSLQKANNNFGEDLEFQLSQTQGDGLTDALLGVNVKIRGAQTKNEITNFTFDQPVQIIFSANNIHSSPLNVISNASTSSGELSIFWNNGIEWIQLGGIPNSANNTISVQTRNAGEFAVRRVSQQYSAFELSSVTPGKIFTPNGDSCNDIVTFQFQNPRGSTNIKGKIFDLYSTFIADLKLSSLLGTLNFAPNCPRPNLSAETLAWDGKDSDGNFVPKGIYLYQIEAEGKIINGTIVVAR